ncbi:hypothetical protein OAF98_00795 [Planctomicrobium sp.]|jgi:hypothetical protein|nr:hypothetical protein [Planctomicrobium sp.]MDA7503875.1 hypothetical protein [bacterium]MDA7527636.1 hypothetical protein [bacterium]MDB4731482.1 hypothetical protein [bacterium]MDB4742996.1 hypothetical protein [Planctomicrobium sp.]
MKNRLTERKTFWVALGTLLGMSIAYYCPQEPAYADSASSSEKFSMCTVETLAGQSEAVFVLDHLTGRLLGAAHSPQTGTFTQTFARNLAADFKVVDNAQYVMVPGRVQVRGGGQSPPANGAIYVGELNSGLVNMYGFTYAAGGRVQPVKELIPIANFPWRNAVQ